MTAAVHGFAETASQAAALARCLGLAYHPVSVRSFPDGESLVTIQPAGSVALLYRSLDRPNGKFAEILLAASALRDGGAKHVILIAPYLAYMRQDMAFHPGEAVSQRVIGQLIAQHFDGLVTVDPHLHRTGSLAVITPGIPAANVSAAAVLRAELTSRREQPSPLLVGPDSESRAWVESIAAPLGLEVLIGEKLRHGDRQVELAIPRIECARGRAVLLVDDVISSGATLIACTRKLQDAGASRIDVLATHCLASNDDLARLSGHGIGRIAATDTIPGPAATISIASSLADGVKAEFGALLARS